MWILLEHFAAICFKIDIISVQIYNVYDMNGAPLDINFLCSAQPAQLYANLYFCTGLMGIILNMRLLSES